MKRLFLQASAWILCILLATACKNAPQNMNGGSYKTMEVTRGTRTLNQNYTAVINGRQSVEIRPQVSGTITQICIDEGAKVKKGQTLVIIDQVPYEAALQTAVANVKNAEAAVATARLMAESKEELFKEHVVSDFDLQTARNSLFQAEATLAQAKADEINARNNLSYTEVKSPVDGVSGMLPYRVGALVDASISTPLTTVSDDEEMYVYFSMTESQSLSTKYLCFRIEPVKNSDDIFSPSEMTIFKYRRTYRDELTFGIGSPRRFGEPFDLFGPKQIILPFHSPQDQIPDVFIMDDR